MLNCQYGDVGEWFNPAVSKTAMPQGIVSSNLTISAFATLKPAGRKRASLGFGVTMSAYVSDIMLYMYYVYSLKCKDGYYIGCTDDINDRVNRHKKGQVPATVDRLPIDLEFYFAIENKYKAFEFEKYLKSGSGRAFTKKHF